MTNRGSLLRRDGAFLLLAIIVFWGFGFPVLNTKNFGIRVDGNQGYIHDFGSMANFAKAFWRGQATYSTESHIRFTSEWAGRPVDRALPFSYSPTMLWILAPFSVLPTAWMYTL